MSTQAIAGSPFSSGTNVIPGYAILLTTPSLVLFVATLNIHDAWALWLLAGINVLWLFVLTGLRSVRLRDRLNTLSTLLEAVHIKDFSIRSRRTKPSIFHASDELDLLESQIDDLLMAEKSNRFADIEAVGLISHVIESVPIAIIATDAEGRIRILNQLASRLTGGTVGVLLEHVILPPLSPDPTGAVDFTFGEVSGRWQVLVSEYRHEGKIGRVISISDVEQVLLSEESQIWQRLIRVISHEINNSLTPITSFCQSLEKIVDSDAPINEDDVKHGLAVIRERAEALKAFVAEYSQIARLPEPVREPVMVSKIIDSVVKLFPEIGSDSEDHEVFIDSALTQQLLINFVHNAIEAGSSSETITIGCRRRGERVEFYVKDNGSGIRQPANLFVPFYSTKEKGQGIGLALCRQIASRHGGFVTLTNNEAEPGATAVFSLPVPSHKWDMQSHSRD